MIRFSKFAPAILLLNFCALAEQPVPLFNAATKLEPATTEETADALVTRFSDRARDRHAREAEFHAYDHYLSFY
jgi:hypothetical protein